MDQIVRRVRDIDRLSDYRVEYETDQYVCLMKLFPTCHLDTTPAIDDYQRFHLRFFIPRECLADAKKKVDRVVVMTNGLDELSTYDLYDELGGRLAARGVVAVLLAMPDHLHRHTSWRKAEPTLEQMTKKPSEILTAEPLKLYWRYEQFKQELARLVDHFRGAKCRDSRGPCYLYDALFASDVRISYLGYSLGAAGMLCAFLENPQRANACFLLNGAINLGDINPGKMIPKEQWQTFITKLQRECREQLTATTSALFEEIFLGQNYGKTQPLLRKHSRRVFFLFGGRDHMIGNESLNRIRPEEWGLGTIVLPGINHFLDVDEEWKKWIRLVVDLIVAYEENAVRETITERAILNLAQSTSSETPESKGMELRARFLGRNRDELLAADKKKQEIKKLIKETPFEELRIGEMLVKLRLTSYSELSRALSIHLAEGKTRKLGGILEEIAGVRPQHVRTLVQAQKKRN